ncbi:hypothetical protein Patl1_25858 [Pistacia atlantica]|uniref:Uncharacterized protein n=1 Tax=Pistacia atlantica TaxID=434234 RepID=A0ACC1B2C2_9ROSI|nr:hypothetical protein Patl1_25858 [Pistacia atlantica]
MNIHSSILLILLVALGIIFISLFQPEQYFFGTEYDVRVINGFSNNSSLPLVIWCSSEDSDLGGRALQEGRRFQLETQNQLLGHHKFLVHHEVGRKKKTF